MTLFSSNGLLCAVTVAYLPSQYGLCKQDLLTEFQHRQLMFYKLEILNAPNSSLESRLTNKQGQDDLSICQELVDLFNI